MTMPVLKHDPLAKEPQLCVQTVTSAKDKQDLYDIRRRAYAEIGVGEPDLSNIYRDAYDELPTTLLLGAGDSRGWAGTLRLCFSSEAGRERLPCEDVYPEARTLRHDRSGTIVELSRLAIEPAIKNNSYRTTVYAAIVKASLAELEQREVSHVLVATLVRWQRFYESLLGFKAISEPHLYPPGDNPVVLMALNYRAAPFARATNSFFR